MLTSMTMINQRQMKRYNLDNELTYPISKKIKKEFLSKDWSIQKRKKFHEEEYHCQVYLKFFPSTLKCSLDVIVKPVNQFLDETDSILIAKTRIPKTIKPGLFFFYSSKVLIRFLLKRCHSCSTRFISIQC